MVRPIIIIGRTLPSPHLGFETIPCGKINAIMLGFSVIKDACAKLNQEQLYAVVFDAPTAMPKNNTLKPVQRRLA